MLDKILKPSVGARAPTHVSREPRYLELDWKSGKLDSAHVLRVLNLNDFTDVESVLDHLRDRSNVIVLKVKPSLVSEKMELKRALKRIQRTTSAIGGDIAGIKEDIIVITPPSIKIARSGGDQAKAAASVSNPFDDEAE
ncbi:MAG: cell division protein SepF [archaeon]